MAATERRCAARRTALALLGLAVLTACMPLPAPRSDVTPRHHVVHRGDNLYRIALEYGLDYRDIAAWNHIPEPYLIYPGDRLVLHPPPGARPVQRAAVPAPGVQATRPQAPPPTPAAAGPQSFPYPGPGNTTPAPRPPPARSAGQPAPAPPPSPVPPVRAAAGRWQWPAEGRTVRPYSAAHGGNKGLDIAGTPGQPVRAAADGVVVYAGDGLRQYGNLIIVKHDAEYLSAYGHLDRALVKEGNRVHAGQAIAYMGRGGGNQGLLHFEIRRRGAPVDPTTLLGAAR